LFILVVVVVVAVVSAVCYSWSNESESILFSSAVLGKSTFASFVFGSDQISLFW